MAAVLQHQVESRVNDLYVKMQRHAQIIMRLSVEVDRVHQENEELKHAMQKNITAIRYLESHPIKSSGSTRSSDIHTSNEMAKEYSEFSAEHNS